MEVTRSLVSLADGPLRGITLMIAVSPAWLVTARVTTATSSSFTENIRGLM